jgi:hypothetical protein
MFEFVVAFVETRSLCNERLKLPGCQLGPAWLMATLLVDT